MSENRKFGVPIDGEPNGILIPALTYRFRVKFAIGDSYLKSLTSELESFEYDIAKKTAKCKIRIPMVSNCVEEDVAFFVRSGSNTIFIDYMDGTSIDEPVRYTKLKIEEITKCEISHHYGSSEVLSVNMEFSLDSIHNVEIKETSKND